MISVELSKGFLDVSVQFFGSVFARFVDFSVIEKCHTFINMDHGSSRLYWWEQKVLQQIAPHR